MVTPIVRPSPWLTRATCLLTVLRTGIVSITIACSECGSPVYPEDRFCGSCGTPHSPSLSDAGTSALSRERAGKLLAELRALTAGEYEIRGEIGRGGMAVVYLAYDLRLNRRVAIKVMLPDLAFHTGGHVNHSVFWNNLSPDGGDKPDGELAAALLIAAIAL